MYTTKKSEIARLRAYRAELEERYVGELLRRDDERARALRDLRRRVVRAILLYEEFHPSGAPESLWPGAAERPVGL